MNDFSRTGHGRRLLEVDIPSIANSLSRIAKQMECSAPISPVPLTTPLTCTELENRTNKGQHPIEAVIMISLTELIDADIDSLNDLASARITGSECGLTEIAYRVVGGYGKENPSDTFCGDILVEVTGYVAFDGL
jgi:hypothetical protein